MGRTYFFYGLELEPSALPKAKEFPETLKVRRQPKNWLSSVRIFRNAKREDTQHVNIQFVDIERIDSQQIDFQRNRKGSGRMADIVSEEKTENNYKQAKRKTS